MINFLLIAIAAAQPRVWLTCPPSFDMSTTRAGIVDAPCESFDPQNSFIQTVPAGSRLKVGWLSGNRGGGYARLSMAAFTPVAGATSPYIPNIPQSEFDRNVLKVTCFGVDSRPNRFSFGSCNHPCNARPGCGFQSSAEDNQRYDTTFTVPYNADGVYLLQLQAYVGVSQNAVYSCAAVRVVGGDSSISCPAPAAIPVPDTCESVSSITAADLTVGSIPGNFCFSPDGTANIDDDINVIPFNPECDPRVGCDFANLVNLCQADITQTIASPTVSPHVTGCTLTVNDPGPIATSMEVPTSTEVPTSIEVPTSTEVPTAIEVPTSTEVPTSIEVPTSTEVPTSIEVPTPIETIFTSTTEPPSTTTQTQPWGCPEYGYFDFTAYACVCKSGYTWNGSACISDTQCITETVTETITETVTETTTEISTTTTTETTTVTVEVQPTPAPPPRQPVPKPPTAPAPEPPSSCGSANPIIPPTTPCNVDEDRITCSGGRLAQCAHKLVDGKIIGQYVFTSCGAGTTCKLTDGVPACGFC